MISLVAPILGFLLFLGLASTLARGQSGRAAWVQATALIAAVRPSLLVMLGSTLWAVAALAVLSLFRRSGDA
jgi:hypothetical protein